MSTFVFFHAHPDDEAILTGGTIRKAVDEGHRAVIVFATAGELGEVPADGLEDDETLAARRRVEVERAAAILGADGVEFLGFRDSGMPGAPSNDDRECFWRADTEVAARRLAQVLLAERAEVLTLYDSDGGYGHPDHIKVHDVGIRAAQMAGTPCVYEATIDRDYMLSLIEFALALGGELPGLPEPETLQVLGVPAARITHVVDGNAVAGAKRAAIAAHASQIGETSIFLGVPEELFPVAWGSEWYIQRRTEHGRDPFAALSERRSG